MLIHAKDLAGCTVHATDGDIGEVRGLYFDCGSCNVRYLGVRAGGTERLIPIGAVAARNLQEKKISVNLSRERIRNSPDVDLNLPVSRDAEISLSQHYGLPLYWETEQAAQGGEVIIVPEAHAATIGGREVEILTEPQGGVIVAEKLPHAQYLFGTDELMGSRVLATDGDAGRVDDFIVDDDTWTMRYLGVDSGAWLNGRKYLVGPGQIDSISRGDREVRLDLPREAISTSPEYDPNRPLDPEYQKRLIEHYSGEVGGAGYALWRFNFMRRTIGQGKKLRIVTMAPAVVHWTADNWRTSRDTKTMDTGANIHIADLETADIPAGSSIHFTFFWPQANRWEGKNFSVRVREMLQARRRERELAGVR